jgi:hypothetical protein
VIPWSSRRRNKYPAKNIRLCPAENDEEGTRECGCRLEGFKRDLGFNVFTLLVPQLYLILQLGFLVLIDLNQSFKVDNLDP